MGEISFFLSFALYKYNIRLFSPIHTPALSLCVCVCVCLLFACMQVCEPVKRTHGIPSCLSWCQVAMLSILGTWQFLKNTDTQT